MSRQLEQEGEDAERKRLLRVARAVDGGLDAALQSEGFELLGFSAKLNAGDCLLTLRADAAEGRVVCFVGSEDLAAAFLKAVREARGGDLRWRKDKYAS